MGLVWKGPMSYLHSLQIAIFQQSTGTESTDIPSDLWGAILHLGFNGLQLETLATSTFELPLVDSQPPLPTFELWPLRKAGFQAIRENMYSH